MGKNSVKKVALGTVVAAAAGYVAGILTAPKSGKETRQDIKEATNKGIAETEKQLKQLHTEASRLIDEAKTQGEKMSEKARNELDGAVAKAKTAKEKARQILSAVHEGDAADADLKKAVKETSSAIDHLKKYLKK